MNPPTGCKFAARCAYVQDRCLEEEPPLLDGNDPGHQYRCWFPVGTPEGVEAKARNEAARAAAELGTGSAASGAGVGVTSGASGAGESV